MGDAGGFLTFIHRQHSMAYKFKRPNSCPSITVTGPSCPFSCMIFWGWWAICLQYLQRAFLETQLFIGADCLDSSLGKVRNTSCQDIFWFRKSFWLTMASLLSHFLPRRPPANWWTSLKANVSFLLIFVQLFFLLLFLLLLIIGFFKGIDQAPSWPSVYGYSTLWPRRLL